MRTTVVRLLVVVGIVVGLWVAMPGSASADTCRSGFRAGVNSATSDGVRKCNGYAGNGARVLGGIGVGLALLLVVRAYRRGARATRPAYPPPGPPVAGPPLPGPPLPGSPPPGSPPASPPQHQQPQQPQQPPPSRPPVRTDEQPRLERFAASALAGELGAQPWTRAVLRVDATGREAMCTVHRPDGQVDTVPAPGDATSTLLELRERMAADGRAPWQHATLTLTSTPDGRVDVAVEYEDPPGR